METNISSGSNLDSEVLLPPRKRLLAGLKKQNLDAEAAAALSLSSLACSSVDVTARLKNVLGSRSNDRSLSLEDIDQVSRSAAAAAAKAAEAAKIAKSVAEEKAAIAVKAIAAAKSALDLAASFSEEAASKERSPRKNKLKKHVPVQQLYKRHKKTDNNRVDEELARKLHHAINSSPRICKKIPSSDLRALKNKKPRRSLSEKSRVPDVLVSLEGGHNSMCNGHAKTNEGSSEGSKHDLSTIDADCKASEYNEPGQFIAISGKAESSHSKEKTLEEMCLNGKKKGRVKLKKLPLSICSYRDRANPKKKMGSENPPSAERNNGSPNAGSTPRVSQEQADSDMPVEATSTWKCQDFKASAFVNKNKVL